ncbi:MAG: VanW family protein [Microthrixaceae bacterium]
MSAPRKAVLAVVAAPLVLIALLAAAWGIDAFLHRDTVVRNVEVAGVAVGGDDRAQATSSVERLATRFAATPVRIETGEFSLDSTAADLGMTVDVDRTTDAALDARRADPLPTRPVRWFRSLLEPTAVPVRVSVDSAKLTAAVGELEGERRTPPVEPTLTGTPDGVTVVPGKDGTELTTNDVVRALPFELDRVGPPIVAKVRRTTVPPSVTDAEVQALADRANGTTEGSIKVTAGSQTFDLAGKDLRPAFTAVLEGPAGDQTARLSMDPAKVAEVLSKKSPASAANPTGVRFTIEGGTPVPVAGRDAQVCCAPQAADVLVGALLDGKKEVTVPTRTITAAEGVEWAKGLGVNQVVGEFTTQHPAGQPRVTNIHLISDAMRGVLIPPGQTMSVNDTVGRRTKEKGYVVAPVIENGKMSEDVGGGVSQFATTLFNAAFFAGLDIPAYMAHTKYISRYPFGREATLAYPSVDLKIRNTTPYGVVVWPSYTGTSVTVQLWSSPYVSGRQTGQNKSSGCGQVVTERTRTWTDGRTATDTFRANYDCEPE